MQELSSSSQRQSTTMRIRKTSSLGTIKTKLHHYAPREVARELTVIDSQLMRQIWPQELEGGAWTKKEVRYLNHLNLIV